MLKTPHSDTHGWRRSAVSVPTDFRPGPAFLTPVPASTARFPTAEMQPREDLGWTDPVPPRLSQIERPVRRRRPDVRGSSPAGSNVALGAGIDRPVHGAAGAPADERGFAAPMHMRIRLPSLYVRTDAMRLA